MTEENTNSQPIARAIGLSKEFRDFWNRPKARAVNDLDFEVYPGEVLGLLGPNGSGKSTTVKLILGLLYPTAGSLSVFGESPRDVKIKKRIGYLPEESYLYKYLTAMETLDFFGALFDLPADERKRRSEQLLEMVGLSHARNRPVGEFSKGMARRIGLAQAMINDPDLLILDEPTSGLDPLGCKEIKDLIKHLQQRGKTVVICSHLLSDVEDICGRVIILYGGKVRATGSLQELLTVQESSRITTPSLSPDITKKVLKILRQHLSEEEFKIDHPQRSLENFFLEVVHQAREESVETSGVKGGGKIADYLQEERNPDEVLKKLTEGEDEKSTLVPEPEEPSEGQDDVKEKLAQLTTEGQESSTAKDSPDKTGKSETEDFSAANEHLEQLLDKSRQKEE